MVTKRPIMICWQSICAVATSLLAIFGVPGIAMGQQHAAGHHHYKFIDLGTLGGPHSYGPVNGAGGRLTTPESSRPLPTPPPNTLAPDCAVPGLPGRARFPVEPWSDARSGGSGRPVQQRRGIDQRLGMEYRPVGNRREFDPAFNFPLFHTVLWKGRKKVDIGTLPGGNTSIGFSVNNAGQVVAFGNNDVPDPFAFFPTATQMRTFLWQDGEVQDIGTLGGPDAFLAPDATISAQV